MPPPALELADIFRRHGLAYRQAHVLPLPQRKRLVNHPSGRESDGAMLEEWTNRNVRMGAN
jgi:hypothetical protein